jgi:branched-chain amino acid transport system ATP-binding protein
MLEVRNLSAGYGSGLALDDVSFTVAPGEVVAVLGTNGAGKTTLMRCLSGLLPVRGGSMSWQGHDLVAAKPWARAGLGLGHVPEGRQVFPDMTVDEHLVMAGQHARATTGSPFDREFVFELFPRLRERVNQPGGTLSGGEQQMLALGRALMLKPELLLLDEPSHGLAPVIVEQISDLIARVAQYVTVLLVEQNLLLPRRIAERAVVLERGVVALEGPAQEILNGQRIHDIYLGVSQQKGPGR